MKRKTERLELEVTEEELRRIDGWRAEQVGVPSRTEAVCQLVEVGLARGSKKIPHITDGEKLLLFMMCELCDHLDVHGGVKPRFINAVLTAGQFWALPRVFPNLYHGNSEDPRNVTHVIGVLDMWGFLEEGYEALPDADKGKMSEAGLPFAPNAFPGFDGKNERDQLVVAELLIDHLERFPRFKDRDLNCHFSTAPAYSRMLKVFERIRPNVVNRKLTAEEMIEILQAGGAT